MFSIAKHTFIELLRDRILGSFVLFGILLLALTTGIEQLTIGGEAQKLLIDMGLGSIALLLLLIVFFVGSVLLLREFQERTICIIFSKPVPRSTFVLGKFLGVALLLFLLTLGFGGMLALLLVLKGIALNGAILQSLAALYCESLFILSMLFFFSSVMSPILTIVTSLLLFLAGSTMPFIAEYMSLHPESMVGSVSWIYYIVPNFGIFHIADVASYGYMLSAPQMGTMLLYGLCYTALFLIGTIFFIRRKEF